MSAELVTNESTESKDNSFALVEKFTNNHEINLVIEDEQKQQAIFITHSL
jgi:hypothetical protein